MVKQSSSNDLCIVIKAKKPAKKNVLMVKRSIDAQHAVVRVNAFTRREKKIVRIAAVIIYASTKDERQLAGSVVVVNFASTKNGRQIAETVKVIMYAYTSV